MERVETRSDRESLADRGLTVVAVAGAVGGAIGGAVLGADIGTAFPLACGTLGTMLGSGSAAGGWCLLTRAWARVVTPSRVHHPIASVRTGTPAPHPG